MKTAVVQLRVEPGQVSDMCDRVIEHIRRARDNGADLVVFGEMVFGYLLGDRWEDESFLRDIESANEAIRDASIGITVLFGSVVVDWDKIGEDGKARKYNAALVATDGQWSNNGSSLGYFVPKTNMPKYRIFDDERHFFSATKLADELGVDLGVILRPFPVPVQGQYFAVLVAAMICEDGWHDEYNNKPTMVYKGQAELLIDISHSPWTFEKRRARERMLGNRVHDGGMPILYVATVGLENNVKNLVLFDGGSCLMAAQGVIVWRAVEHRESLTIVDPFTQETCTGLPEPATGVAEVCDAIIAAMRIWCAPFPKVIFGLSGGVDSAVMLGLAVLALGSDKVCVANMPTRFNSKTTRKLAKQCADRAGVEYHVVPIGWLFGVAKYVLLRWRLTTLVLENMQAVLRMFILNAIAQSVGGIILNTGNDTESAFGWCTKRGDCQGDVAFLGNLPKGWIYTIGREINRRAQETLGYELIPEGVFTVVPAAELSAEQNPEEGKGDPIFYPYHDQLVRAWREGRTDPMWVLEHLRAGDLEEVLGCTPGTVTRYFGSTQAFVDNLEWAWRSFHGSVHKRGVMPPILIVFRRAFGFDLRETIGTAVFSKKYAALKRRVLSEVTL